MASKPLVLMMWSPSHRHLHSEMENGAIHSELSCFC